MGGEDEGIVSRFTYFLFCFFRIVNASECGKIMKCI